MDGAHRRVRGRRAARRWCRSSRCAAATARWSGWRSSAMFTPPALSQLEEALERCRQFAGTVVTADLWDVERLPACDALPRSTRTERLAPAERELARAEPRDRLCAGATPDVTARLRGRDRRQRVRRLAAGAGARGAGLRRRAARARHASALRDRRVVDAARRTSRSSGSACATGFSDCYQLATHGRWLAASSPSCVAD